MSPRKFDQAAATGARDGTARFWISVGLSIRDARLGKHWSVADLARRAAVSKSLAYLVEAGQPTSVEAVARLTSALGLRMDVQLVDPRQRESRPNLSADPVHSMMGEFEAAHLRGLELHVGIDEPYQHYQFAGRADLVAWDVDARALLHIENRTRFPDFQEMAGAFNAKCAYLAGALGDRVGVFGWRSQTHVIVALWSAEVIHALRLRTASFRALCPDSAQAFQAWWSGAPPTTGSHKTVIVLDPAPTGRRQPWIALDEALARRPRYRGYADAAATIEMKGATAAASSSG